MTTITIERALLEQALNALLLPCDRWNAAQHKIVTAAADALLTALAAPATAPEFNPDWARMIHYPECWDTAAYPELSDAIHEVLAWSGCSVCKPATAPSWQDAPTCAGIWLAKSSGIVRLVDEHDIEHLQKYGLPTWYGPIPEDKQ